MTLSNLTDIAASNIAAAQKELAVFSAKLAENPAHAMEWSGRAFTAAAALKVYMTVERWIQNAHAGLAEQKDEVAVLRAITHFSLRQVLQAASRATSRSSSPTSNLMEDAEGAAWTGLYETLTRGW